MAYNTGEGRVTLILFYFCLWLRTWHAIIACGENDYSPRNPNKGRMAEDILGLIFVWVFVA
jgi:hypothetical protein